MKFDLPTTEAILQDLRDEVPYKYAAESNGVAMSTLQLWLDNGMKDIKEGKTESHYAQFLLAVRKIEKERIKRHQRNIASEERSHKGSEWILERAFWKQFGKASEIDLNERVEKLENKANDNVLKTEANAGQTREVNQEGSADEAGNES
jgi:hypothetical protein